MNDELPACVRMLQYRLPLVALDEIQSHNLRQDRYGLVEVAAFAVAVDEARGLND
jgi:hypothetical protein